MPYKIYKRVGGYGVKRIGDGNRFLSNKPQTRKTAEAMLAAVRIAEYKSKKKNKNNGKRNNKN